MGIFSDNKDNFDLGFFLYMQECLEEEEKRKKSYFEQTDFDNNIEDEDEENDYNKIR